MLGLRSTAAGPAVATELIWLLKNGKKCSTPFKLLNPINGVVSGLTCKMQVGQEENRCLLNCNNRIKQAVVRKSFMALNACIAQGCILIASKRKHRLIHLLSVKHL
jgi:hypothetical protein